MEFSKHYFDREEKMAEDEQGSLEKASSMSRYPNSNDDADDFGDVLL